MQVRLTYREPRIIEREPDAPDNLTQREPKSAMIASPAADNLKPLHLSCDQLSSEHGHGSGANAMAAKPA